MAEHTERTVQTSTTETTGMALIVERAARWYVFVFLNIYGIAKFFGGQFYLRGELPPEVASTMLGEASAFDLAWTFMGYSAAYMFFIGAAEVLGAWLLLWERTKLFGVAVLLPVMTNVIVFDIIFLDAYGALASATIYTLLLFVILYLNKETILQAIRTLWAPRLYALTSAHTAKRLILIAGLMALLFVLDQSLVNFFGHGKG